MSLIKKFKYRDNPSACLLYLYALENELDTNVIKISAPDLAYLRKEKIIIREDNKIIVNPNNHVEGFYDKVKEYRKLFKGIRDGSMGNLQITLKKMRKWLMENPEYSIEDVMIFAEQYVLEKAGLARNADNFIYKTIKTDGVQAVVSTLSDFIESKKDNMNYQINI